jgi:hypothetical protein
MGDRPGLSGRGPTARNVTKAGNRGAKVKRMDKEAGRARRAAMEALEDDEDTDG